MRRLLIVLGILGGCADRAATERREMEGRIRAAVSSDVATSSRVAACRAVPEVAAFCRHPTAGNAEALVAAGADVDCVCVLDGSGLSIATTNNRRATLLPATQRRLQSLRERAADDAIRSILEAPR